MKKLKFVSIATFFLLLTFVSRSETITINFDFVGAFYQGHPALDSKGNPNWEYLKNKTTSEAVEELRQAYEQQESSSKKPIRVTDRTLLVLAEKYSDGIISMNISVLNKNKQLISIPPYKNYKINLYDARGNKVTFTLYDIQKSNDQIFIDLLLGNSIHRVQSVEVYIHTNKDELIYSPKTRVK